MNMKCKVGASALLAVTAGLFAGCAGTQPVGEYEGQCYYERGPGLTQSSCVSTYGYTPAVGERVYYDYGRPRIGRRVYDATTQNWEAPAPFGPNSPTSPSQWW